MNTPGHDHDAREWEAQEHARRPARAAAVTNPPAARGRGCSRALSPAVEQTERAEWSSDVCSSDLEELSIPEISRITGIAEGTIKSHLFRSRKQLRAILESSIGAIA